MSEWFEKTKGRIDKAKERAEQYESRTKTALELINEAEKAVVKYDMVRADVETARREVERIVAYMKEGIPHPDAPGTVPEAPLLQGTPVYDTEDALDKSEEEWNAYCAEEREICKALDTLTELSDALKYHPDIDHAGFDFEKIRAAYQAEKYEEFIAGVKDVVAKFMRHLEEDAEIEWAAAEAAKSKPTEPPAVIYAKPLVGMESKRFAEELGQLEKDIMNSKAKGVEPPGHVTKLIEEAKKYSDKRDYNNAYLATTAARDIVNTNCRIMLMRARAEHTATPEDGLSEVVMYDGNNLVDLLGADLDPKKAVAYIKKLGLKPVDHDNFNAFSAGPSDVVIRKGVVKRKKPWDWMEHKYKTVTALEVATGGEAVRKLEDIVRANQARGTEKKKAMDQTEKEFQEIATINVSVPTEVYNWATAHAGLDVWQDDVIKTRSQKGRLWGYNLKAIEHEVGPIKKRFKEIEATIEAGKKAAKILKKADVHGPK